MTTKPATIVYPETDGMPLPDGAYQAPLYYKVNAELDVHFKDDPHTIVNGNTFIYYTEGDPRRSVAPDCFVIFEVSDEALESIKRHNTHLLWEIGKAPDFVLEIGSKSTADEDLGRKRDLYAQMGVREYWRYDATGGDFYGEGLVGESLVDGEYRRLEMHVGDDGSTWGRSEVLSLDIWWSDEKVRLWDRESGSWLLSHEEEQAGRLQAEARADQETARRLEAEARLAEVESELRRLRGE